MKALLIEDNPIDAQAVRDAIARHPDAAIELAHVASLAQMSAERDPETDVVLLDLSLPDGHGLQSIERVRAELPRAPIVVLTAEDDPDTSLRMVRGGAQDYLIKGRFGGDTLVRAMRYAVERARAEELRQHLYHADRLAVVGQLAAGVAHEIANPTTFVAGNLTLVRRKLEQLEVLRKELLQHAQGASEACQATIAELSAQLPELSRLTHASLDGVARIVGVARDLQGYARVERRPIEPVQLNDVALATCNLTNSVVKHRAALRADLGEVPLVMGDRGGLEQVLTNLIMNAAQAVPEGAPQAQRVTVSTRLTDEGVVLSVSDTGPGVSEAILERIFEPFFTTKARGSGTGLGLSIASEIARSHGGSLRCRNLPEGGACFELVLPAAPQHTPLPQARQSQPASAPPPRRLRLLVIDDEQGIRDVYRELLEADYDVVLGAGGREAIELLQHDRRFDVILCDLMMPDLDGQRLHELVAEMAPELLPHMVFSSGGLVTERARAFAARLENPLLEKPVALETLRSTIKRIALA